MVAVVHTESLIQQEIEAGALNPESTLVVPAYSKMNGITAIESNGKFGHSLDLGNGMRGEKEKEDFDEDKQSDISDEESIKNGTVEGQVVIYESGKAILKVESGTTLEVVKLLYETESAKENNIIGVRPKLSNGGIPCIVTLQDSKLEESSYDLITKDKRSPRASPVTNGAVSPSTSSSPETNSTCTTRCIECSRESWKTKRYTNVGMNTEISINPLMDGESARSITGAATKQSSKAVLTNDAPAPRRGRPPIQRQPNYSSLHPKEFMVTPIPSMPVPVSEMEFRHFSRRSPRSSPVHMFGHTKIYPPVEPRGMDLDAVSYDSMRSMRHAPPPHHHSRRPSPPRHIIKMEGDRRSPPRRQRSRSPIYYKNGYMKEEPREYYHHALPMKGNEAKKRHISPRYYPYEVPPPPAVLIPAPPPQRLVERLPSPLPTQIPEDPEPTVYVLPEGFDLEKDGLDPSFMAAQKESPNASPKQHNGGEKNAEIKHSPIQPRERSSPPATMTSPKPAVSEEQRAQPRSDGAVTYAVEHKLSCKICKQSFPTKSTLYKHLRGHSSDEKPFKCNECGQGFTLSSNLRQHRIIHRGYKPFQCEYCGKKFMRSNVYKQHRRIHTGEQMHKCDLCPSEFLQKYALVKHLKKVHNIETYEN